MNHDCRGSSCTRPTEKPAGCEILYVLQNFGFLLLPPMLVMVNASPTAKIPEDLETSFFLCLDQVQFRGQTRFLRAPHFHQPNIFSAKYFLSWMGRVVKLQTALMEMISTQETLIFCFPWKSLKYESLSCS